MALPVDAVEEMEKLHALGDIFVALEWRRLRQDQQVPEWTHPRALATHDMAATR